MAMERVPYLVGGGFEHSAEIMRAALATATSGAEGIVRPGDFRVLPMPVPGGSVRIIPGNALLRNTYGGGGSQSYAVRAPEQTELPILATGSSGARSDLIVARVDDPTYAGGEFDPETFEAAKFEVIRGVPSSTTTAKSLGLPYPAIELARVTLPASTGTVTAGMIKDLRSVALPRTLRRLYTIQPTSSVQLPPKARSWANFPRDRFSIAVPGWATHAVINAELGSMFINGTAANLAIVTGKIRFLLGGQATEESWFTHRSNAQGLRFGTSVADTIVIPANRRGQVALSAAQLISSSDSTASWYMDTYSFSTVDIEFQERAE